MGNQNLLNMTITLYDNTEIKLLFAAASIFHKSDLSSIYINVITGCTSGSGNMRYRNSVTIPYEAPANCNDLNRL